MSATYKLTYFPVMAVGEPIRWLLSYGKLPFEDIRLSPEQWDQQKNNSPFGSVPIFEVDGKVMHQSLAICRYLGNVVGLSGANEWENFEIDVAVDSISDLRGKIAVYNKLPNNSPERPPLKKILLEQTLPYYLTRFEKMAKRSYFANGKLSWADIYFVSLLDYNNGVLKLDIIDKEKYPTLDKIRNEVRSIPEIVKWIENRPITEY